MKKRSKTNMRNEADRRFSILVRSRGACEAWRFDKVSCSGNLQTAHVFSRRYLSVRWAPENAFCLCAAHHVFFTHHPLEFEDYCEEVLGASYRLLRERALQPWDRNIEGVLDDLKASESA